MEHLPLDFLANLNDLAISMALGMEATGLATILSQVRRLSEMEQVVQRRLRLVEFNATQPSASIFDGTTEADWR